MYKRQDIAFALEKGDVHLMAVLERHHGTGNVGLGLLRGYGLKDGAVATTVAHDSHNLIVIGTSPEEMCIRDRLKILLQRSVFCVKIILYDSMLRKEIFMEAYAMYFIDLILHLDKHLPEIMMAYGHLIYAILFMVRCV